MPSISRRHFMKGAATCTAAAAFVAARSPYLHADPLGLPLGCQTWPVREMIAKDFPGTIKQLAGAGFQTIELCSPVGYADSGFGGLASYKGSELRKVLSDAGVSCISSHFGITELRNNQERAIAWEGKGVEPDVKVSAADALATAEKLAADKLAAKNSQR